MTDDPPSHPGAGPHVGPPVGQLEPGYPAPQASGSRTWPLVALGAMVLALIATVVAVVALVFATSRSSGSSTAPTSTAPTYSAAEVSAAHRQLCDAYTLGARAVGVDTNGNNPALARIALTNAAAMLDNANADPALGQTHRDAARRLSMAYRTLTAKSSSNAFTESEYSAALDDVRVADAAMKKVCGMG